MRGSDFVELTEYEPTTEVNVMHSLKCMHVKLVVSYNERKLSFFLLSKLELKLYFYLNTVNLSDKIIIKNYNLL